MRTTDSSGRVLYTIEDTGKRKFVKNRDGRVIGWISEGKTYNASGKMIAFGESPGLLI